MCIYTNLRKFDMNLFFAIKKLAKGKKGFVYYIRLLTSPLSAYYNTNNVNY